MNVTIDDMMRGIKAGKILPYEMELINRLRDFHYQGVPLSVIVLCFPICNRNCYPTSIYLTLGMNSFRLVHGNINIFPKNGEYPNHSWVEKDGYVYDPTDGYKYEKQLYYQFYNPEVIEVYDEKTVNFYPFYHEVVGNLGSIISEDNLTLMLQYLEILEEENPTVNHTLLLEEIHVCREQYGITKKYSSEAMAKYRSIMKENLE